jgi:hypothetical protein
MATTLSAMFYTNPTMRDVTHHHHDTTGDIFQLFDQPSFANQEEESNELEQLLNINSSSLLTDDWSDTLDWFDRELNLISECNPLSDALSSATSPSSSLPPTPPSSCTQNDIGNNVTMLLQDPQQLTTSPPSSTQPVSPPSYSLPPSPTPSPPLKPLKRSGKFSTKDRKQRKKLQNKTAALRYRQKKKDEYEVLQEKEKELEAKNAKLKQQATDLAAELAYLKNLWIEIYQPKAKN